jgi:hypothetical protein
MKRNGLWHGYQEPLEFQATPKRIDVQRAGRTEPRQHSAAPAASRNVLAIAIPPVPPTPPKTDPYGRDRPMLRSHRASDAWDPKPGNDSCAALGTGASIKSKRSLLINIVLPGQFFDNVRQPMACAAGGVHGQGAGYACDRQVVSALRNIPRARRIGGARFEHRAVKVSPRTCSDPDAMGQATRG